MHFMQQPLKKFKGKDMDVSEIHVKISEIKKVIGKII